RPGPGPCQPCALRFDAESCEGDATCRWLTPGCNLDPRDTFGLPGCYPLDDCLDDPLQCEAGKVCDRVSYDPCWNSTCNACAAEAWICRGEIDGARSCEQRGDFRSCATDSKCEWLQSPTCVELQGLPALSNDAGYCRERSEDCASNGVCDANQACVRYQVEACPDPDVDCRSEEHTSE